jgi:photosystem II stability/assembly factor-like uncharacterized protein
MDQLLGHYRIISKLGEGGMGVVYRAHDEVLQRDVALKFVGANLAGEARQTLLREARAASALSHPNICTIHEIGEASGEFYIVMELIAGEPLSALIARRPLPFESVVRYGAQIASALMHAHGRNIIHRDLKSSNMVVTAEGLLKVLDFGLARRLPPESKEIGTQTIDAIEAAPTTGGTLPYIAPEVLRGESGDHRSDLWSLGVVLYEAITGEMPFQGRTGFEIISAILAQPPAPVPAHVPPGLTAIIQRCLAKEPALRYQGASEVHAALEAIQAIRVAAEPRGDQTATRTTLHRGIKHLNVKQGDVLLFVGTTKGIFLLRSTARRTRWDVAGPYFHGQYAYALAYDGRAGRHRLWASTVNMWGVFLRSSDDFGRTWTNPQQAPIRFPANSGVSLKNIWQICVGRAEEPDTIYCGVEPAALYKSEDDGETWSLVSGLFDHPHRPRWVPGMGGLALHTILLDPQNHERMYVAISAGGVYATEDGGRTWRPRNRGIRIVYAPERFPEFGQCVHKIAMHPSRPERIFLQNHWGLYRSDNMGESWQDIANGVPSDFGYAMVVHPNNPDWVYIVPVESDEFRCTPEGRLRVYRTRNAGETWEALFRGLPQKGAYETVLRDALTTDSLSPAGVYFGTRSGQIYGSIDDGKTWKRLLEGLPPVVCVKTGLVGNQRGHAPRRSSAVAVQAKTRVGETRQSRRKK